MVPVVQVLDTNVDDRSGNNERGAWRIRRQSVWIGLGGPFPEKFDISLDDGQVPYPVGEYLIDGASFDRGKYGLEVKRSVKLVPLSQAVSELQAASRSGVKAA